MCFGILGFEFLFTIHVSEFSFLTSTTPSEMQQIPKSLFKMSSQMAFNKIFPPKITGLYFHIIRFKNSDNEKVQELETRQKNTIYVGERR